MPKRRSNSRKAASAAPEPETNAADAAIEGIQGTGPWLVFSFEPTSLFSLKVSSATSGVGRTLLVPTPYAIKMALVDAALRTGWQGDPDFFVRALARTRILVAPPERAVVTSTLIKIRQENKAGTAYIPSVAFREFVAYRGLIRCAVDLATVSLDTAQAIITMAPRVFYLGKRGGFVQFIGAHREDEPGHGYCQAIEPGLEMPSGFHISVLDDFGPEATFDALNSYSTSPIQRGKHRIFREMVVPLAMVAVGPGFAEYANDTEES